MHGTFHCFVMLFVCAFFFLQNLFTWWSYNANKWIKWEENQQLNTNQMWEKFPLSLFIFFCIAFVVSFNYTFLNVGAIVQMNWHYLECVHSFEHITLWLFIITAELLFSIVIFKCLLRSLIRISKQSHQFSLITNKPKISKYS